MGKKASAAVLIFLIFLISACLGGGGGGDSTPASSDITPPTTPSSLQASCTYTGQVDLFWDMSLDDTGVTGYRIYRDGNFLKTVTGTSTSDSGLPLNTNYCYRISAYDAAGNASGQCSEKCATTVAWTTRLLSTQMDLKAIVWTGSKYVVGGDDREILTSTDGTRWSFHSTNFTTPDRTEDIAWSGSVFAAVTSWGDVYRSTDGMTWDRVYYGYAYPDLQGIVWTAASSWG